MGRDAFNVAIGIIAQMTLVTIPLYMVLRDMKGLWISVARPAGHRLDPEEELVREAGNA